MSVLGYYNNMEMKTELAFERQNNPEFDKFMKNIGFYQR